MTTSDVTAAQTLYFDPYNGNNVPIYDGTRWNWYSFSELSIPLTTTQSCTTTNSSATLVVADSRQLVRGMQVSGTGIQSSTTISSITDQTHIVLSKTATSSATNTITFKLPPNSVYDVWLTTLIGGAPTLQFGNAWTGKTTRNDAISVLNGVYVNTSAINSADSNAIPANQGLHLGIMATTSTAGQTEDSVLNRLACNRYNRRVRDLFGCPGYADSSTSNTSWTTTSTSWTQADGAASGSALNFLTLGEDYPHLQAQAFCGNASGGAALVGIGLDSTTAVMCAADNTATVNVSIACSTGNGNNATSYAMPVAGLHTAYLLGVVASGTGTYFASIKSLGADHSPPTTYLLGHVWG